MLPKNIYNPLINLFRAIFFMVRNDRKLPPRPERRKLSPDRKVHAKEKLKSYSKNMLFILIQN